MKKILFFLFALFASFNLVQAQNNVTNDKYVYPLGGLKTYTNGSDTQTTISNDDLQKITKDGNTDHVYIFPEGGYDTDENKNTGIQGFYINLGQSTSISAIHTTWEGAAASFKVYLSNSEPTNGTYTDATKIAEYSSYAQETSKNVNVTSDATGQYIIFVPETATNYAWGVKIHTFVAYDKSQAELGSIVVSPIIVGAGSQQTFTVKAYSTTGIEIPSGPTYTFDGTNSDLTNVMVNSGEHTIVATYYGKTAEAKVYGTTVPAAPATEDTKATLYGNDGAASEGTTNFINYDRGANGVAPTELTIGSSKVKYATNAGKLHINNGALTADINQPFTNKGGKGYKTLSLDLWSAEEQSGNLVVNADGTDKPTPISLEAAKWTTVQVSLEDITEVGNISIQLDSKNNDNVYPDFAVANVYMLDISVEANPFNIAIKNDVATITGNVAAENVEAINNADVIMIDMSGVNAITEAITITPKNPNALVKVAGTVDGIDATADIKYDNLTANNKVVVNTWVYPVDQIELTDDVEAKFWNGEGTTQKYISTGNKGYKITRKLEADKYYTTCLPVAVDAIDGVEVYEFDSFENNKITFTKKEDGNIAANTPYLLKATQAAELVAEGDGDLNLANINGESVKTGLTFKGNGVAFNPETGTSLAGLTADGKIQKLSEKATVGAFRAYFEFLENQTEASIASYSLVIGDDNTTGINSINAAQESNSFYNLQGMPVKQPKKGLYISNGKKIIIK